ncbi:tetratricopeptide repeat protein [Chryseotalea sanaruensis]|uniref:Tetratricopeptide repeat protein n=1 Tax=Chryseotalea sanaruensis TaxID=2482724 RepID=A0A401UEX9_9BACT|nr:thioredoxin family protein [Chryseotalea sanaruensis]GCC53456.1 tetratricopeptide repeat protein [Chryseotalea sanaruensis]
MKKFILLIVLFCNCENVVAQASKKLLGLCNRDSLLLSPWKEWFEPNYTNYKPEADFIAKLRKNLSKDYSFEVYFGTWCGDSKRELPRFYKIINESNFPENKIKLVAVDSGENYKQSPGGETIGKGIYRVATFIVLKNGFEVGRVTEHPVYTLEEDIFKIISGGDYESNFRTYKHVDQWLERGLMSNPNVSLKGLAKQLKPLLITPSELSSCAKVLTTQGKLKEAIFICRINTYIFYDNPETYSMLARTLSKDGQHKEALENIEYAIKINTDNEELQYLLTSFYNIKLASN